MYDVCLYTIHYNCPVTTSILSLLMTVESICITITIYINYPSAIAILPLAPRPISEAECGPTATMLMPCQRLLRADQALARYATVKGNAHIKVLGEPHWLSLIISEKQSKATFPLCSI